MADGRPGGPHRLTWVGGVLGPAAFVAAWAAAGVLVDGYSPRTEAISRLAASGAPTRALMTAGFVVFGIGVPLFSLALRRVLAGPAWIAAAGSGLATIGVALLPLERSSTFDAAHGACATAGYVALVATPLLAARPLWRSDRRAAAWLSVGVGLTAAACLTATTVVASRGLWQRAGLTLLDAWLVAVALTIALRRAPTASAAGPAPS